MMAFLHEDITDLRRWAICGGVTVLAHGGIAAAMINWYETIEAGEPAAAIVIEFAPVPVGPPMQQVEIPPGPEQVMSDASLSRPTKSLKEKIEEKIEQKVEAKLEQKIEEKIEARPTEEPPPEVPPAPNPEVPVAPPPPQEVKHDTPQRQEPRPSAPVTSAPAAIREQTAALAAAPNQGQLAPRTSDAVPTWKTRVVALLERNKRYPGTAQSRREHGVAQVFFSLDRQGRVIESRVVRSSGATSLDEEALALLRRAQPFPAPPRELAGDHVDLTVAIRFNLK
jgi:protein TonB